MHHLMQQGQPYLSFIYVGVRIDEDLELQMPRLRVFYTQR